MKFNPDKWKNPASSVVLVPFQIGLSHNNRDYIRRHKMQDELRKVIGEAIEQHKAASEAR